MGSHRSASKANTATKASTTDRALEQKLNALGQVLADTRQLKPGPQEPTTVKTHPLTFTDADGVQHALSVNAPATSGRPQVTIGGARIAKATGPGGTFAGVDAGKVTGAAGRVESQATQALNSTQSALSGGAAPKTWTPGRVSASKATQVASQTNQAGQTIDSDLNGIATTLAATTSAPPPAKDGSPQQSGQSGQPPQSGQPLHDGTVRARPNYKAQGLGQNINREQAYTDLSPVMREDTSKLLTNGKPLARAQAPEGFVPEPTHRPKALTDAQKTDKRIIDLMNHPELDYGLTDAERAKREEARLKMFYGRVPGKKGISKYEVIHTVNTAENMAASAVASHQGKPSQPGNLDPSTDNAQTPTLASSATAYAGKAGVATKEYVKKRYLGKPSTYTKKDGLAKLMGFANTIAKLLGVPTEAALKLAATLQSATRATQALILSSQLKDTDPLLSNVATNLAKKHGIHTGKRAFDTTVATAEGHTGLLTVVDGVQDTLNQGGIAGKAVAGLNPYARAKSAARSGLTKLPKVLMDNTAKKGRKGFLEAQDKLRRDGGLVSLSMENNPQVMSGSMRLEDKLAPSEEFGTLSPQDKAQVRAGIAKVIRLAQQARRRGDADMATARLQQELKALERLLIQRLKPDKTMEQEATRAEMSKHAQTIASSDRKFSEAFVDLVKQPQKTHSEELSMARRPQANTPDEGVDISSVLSPSQV
ncbi:MAG: hypothetical protein AAFS10_12420, partial [Myxococcota bacterium]